MRSGVTGGDGDGDGDDDEDERSTAATPARRAAKGLLVPWVPWAPSSGDIAAGVAEPEPGSERHTRGGR